MGVRSAATKLHIPPAHSAARRSFFLPLAAVALLCSASYLLGAWHHGGGFSPSSPSRSVTIATDISCTTTTLTPSTTTAAAAQSLDFSAHHAAAVDAVASRAASSASSAPRRYPACPAEYSEYTPCEDVKRSLRYPRDRLVYRERHCPSGRERLRCLVPAPAGYRNPFPWPASRDVAWFANVPSAPRSTPAAGWRAGARTCCPGTSWPCPSRRGTRTRRRCSSRWSAASPP
ncbi:unnamed protein product [Triticum turgidum subsp. durum]|uniref:Methyltransferase n=1 Tax=Triticum turgidum subsp. durum TaxID=4567 RepID=A0A9R0Y4D0_TRITD|nr:unnamed protein product [Triticum turgidum subsp. durum]